MSPLVWWNVKEHIKPQQQVQRGYAVLGYIPEAENSLKDDASGLNGATRTPVLLNTDSPWSAFLCGSQGSGKSHALSCMLENCLLTRQYGCGRRRQGRVAARWRAIPTGSARWPSRQTGSWSRRHLATTQYGCGRRRQGGVTARWRAIPGKSRRSPSRQTGRSSTPMQAKFLYCSPQLCLCLFGSKCTFLTF
jgi:hypothetical protein